MTKVIYSLAREHRLREGRVTHSVNPLSLTLDPYLAIASFRVFVAAPDPARRREQVSLGERVIYLNPVTGLLRIEQRQGFGLLELHGSLCTLVK